MQIVGSKPEPVVIYRELYEGYATCQSHSSPSPYPTFTISLAERILMQIVGSEPEAVVIYRELYEGHAICSKPFLAFAISQLCHIPRGENFDADCWF